MFIQPDHTYRDIQKNPSSSGWMKWSSMRIWLSAARQTGQRICTVSER